MKYRLTVLAVPAAADNHVEQVNNHLDEWSEAGWTILNISVRHLGVAAATAEYTTFWQKPDPELLTPEPSATPTASC
ncbi:MAG: hypothetical protein JWO63_394 [Frankiales bacterium]|nr:hypothetical protein [Frankiales bacterium]